MLRRLSMNRPTPEPSQEGSRQSSVSCPFPSWEGLGVGSWSQCMRESDKRLFMNRSAELQLRTNERAERTMNTLSWSSALQSK